jgi:hypothetical protein
MGRVNEQEEAMKVIAENGAYRLIYVHRGYLAPAVKEDWRLQKWNGQDWGGSTRMFDDKDEAMAAAKAVGLDATDGHP